MTNILRICGICLILLAVQKLEAKAVQPQVQRAKRGYSQYGENDFGSSVHVSSGILQYSTPDEQPTIDVSNSYDHSSWQPSSPPAGYDVWMEPSQSYHPPPPSISSVHPGSDHISNSVFSTDSHGAHVDLPQSSEGLHTQTSSSSSLGDGDIDIAHLSESEHISDNIDFNNIADIKSKHYAKSYGK